MAIKPPTYWLAILAASVLMLVLAACATTGGGGGTVPFAVPTLPSADGVGRALYKTGGTLVVLSVVALLARAFIPVMPIAANLGTFFLGLVLIYAGDVWTSHKMWIVGAGVLLGLMYLLSAWDNLTLLNGAPKNLTRLSRSLAASFSALWARWRGSRADASDDDTRSP